MSKAIIPDNMLNADTMRRAVTNALEGAAKGAKADFKGTTATWDEQPEFSIVSRGPWVRIVGTSDLIYHFVNGGTVRHEVTAHGGMLHFYTGGRPKSAPGRLRSNKGSKGRTEAWAKRVTVSGIKPRAFDKAIAEKWQAQMQALFQRAIDSAIKR